MLIIIVISPKVLEFASSGRGGGGRASTFSFRRILFGNSRSLPSCATRCAFQRVANRLALRTVTVLTLPLRLPFVGEISRYVTS
jgi:hypothetical protein